MAELKQDPTHPLKHEQCYLCFTTLVEPPPPNAPSREEVRRPHKEYMAKLESEGRLFGAGLLKNDKDNDPTCDLGYGMFILRAETRAEAEAIATEEPNTKAGLRTMRVVPWLRGEGDINISISFTNGTVKIDRRSYLLENGWRSACRRPRDDGRIYTGRVRDNQLHGGRLVDHVLEHGFADHHDKSAEACGNC